MTSHRRKEDRKALHLLPAMVKAAAWMLETTGSFLSDVVTRQVTDTTHCRASCHMTNPRLLHSHSVPVITHERKRMRKRKRREGKLLRQAEEEGTQNYIKKKFQAWSRSLNLRFYLKFNTIFSRTHKCRKIISVISVFNLNNFRFSKEVCTRHYTRKRKSNDKDKSNVTLTPKF